MYHGWCFDLSIALTASKKLWWILVDGATETEAVGSVPCPYLPGVGVRAVGLVVPHRPDSPRVRSERLGRCSSGVGERHRRCPFPQPWATVVAPVASEMGRRGKIPLGVCYDQPAHSSAPSVPAGILIYPRKVARTYYMYVTLRFLRCQQKQMGSKN